MGLACSAMPRFTCIHPVISCFFLTSLDANSYSRVWCLVGRGWHYIREHPKPRTLDVRLQWSGVSIPPWTVMIFSETSPLFLKLLVGETGGGTVKKRHGVVGDVVMILFPRSHAATPGLYAKPESV
jgi:hypothetical protein